MKVEYRVKEVKRYVVTRYTDDGLTGSIETFGEFPNARVANITCNGLAHAEHPDTKVEQFPLHQMPESALKRVIAEDQINRMVDRFLGWKLPEDFYPDGGITFDRTFSLPVGTNLFTATQAKAMIKYITQGVTLEKVEGK